MFLGQGHKRRVLSLFRVVSLILIPAILFCDPTFAQLADSRNSDNLSPDLRLAREAFKNRYLARHLLLEHQKVNEHIASCIPPEGISKLALNNIDKVMIMVNGRPEQLDIRIAGIPGLSKVNNGKRAHMGMGTANGMPVVYIDSDYYYYENLRQFYRNKVTTWEAKRRELGISYGRMKEWIKTSPEARQLAGRIVDYAGEIGDLEGELSGLPDDKYDVQREWYRALISSAAGEDDSPETERRKAHSAERRIEEKKPRRRSPSGGGGAIQKKRGRAVETMGMRIKAKMDEKGWGVPELVAAIHEAARAMGRKVKTTPKAAKDWPTDVHHPDIKIIPILARALDMDTAALVTGLPLERALREPVAMPGETARVSPSLGRRVLILRWVNGMTPKELSKKAGVGEGTVTHTERYLLTYPRPSHLAGYAAAFSVSASLLLTGHEREYVIDHLRYPQDKFTFLRLCACLTQEESWRRLVDDFGAEIEGGRPTIAQWERGVIPTEEQTRAAVCKLYNISWERLSEKNTSGSRLRAFFATEAEAKAKAEFEKALAPGMPDSALVAHFPKAVSDIIMSYSDTYDVDAVVNILFSIIRARQDREQRLAINTITERLDFYQKLFSLKSGSHRLNEEKAKYFASLILRRLIRRLKRAGLLTPAASRIDRAPYWCDIVAGMCGKKSVAAAVKYLEAEKKDAAFPGRAEFMRRAGISRSLANRYGISNIAYRLGYRVPDGATDSHQFLHYAHGFKERVWEYYQRDGKFPVGDAAEITRSDRWAIELLKHVLGGSVESFRTKFFDEYTDWIKDHIRRQRRPAQRAEMYRELLWVLPLDKDAMEFSLTDRKSRSKDTPVEVIVPDCRTNTKTYALGEDEEALRVTGYADFKELSLEQRIALWDEIRRGNPDARDFVMNANIGLVISAARVISRLPMARKIAISDLIQEGWFGLRLAVERFDARKGYKFSTYALFWIKAVQRRFCKRGGQTIKGGGALLSRYFSLRKQIAQMEGYAAHLRSKRSYDIQMAKLRREYEILGNRLRPILWVPSISDEVGRSSDGDPLEREATLKDEDAQDPEEAYGALQTRDITRMCIDSMEDSRQRRILQLRYGLLPPSDEEWAAISEKHPDIARNPMTNWPGGRDSCTLEEVAAIFDVTKEWIRQIEPKAEAEFRRLYLAATNYIDSETGDVEEEPGSSRRRSPSGKDIPAGEEEIAPKSPLYSYQTEDPDPDLIREITEVNNRNADLKSWNKYLEDPSTYTGSQFITARDGKGDLLGFVGYTNRYDYGFLFFLGVDIKVRNKGIGKELMRKHIELAKKNGNSFVVFASEPKAIMPEGYGEVEIILPDHYKALGKRFIEEGIIRDYAVFEPEIVARSDIEDIRKAGTEEYELGPQTLFVYVLYDTAGLREKVLESFGLGGLTDDDVRDRMAGRQAKPASGETFTGRRSPSGGDTADADAGQQRELPRDTREYLQELCVGAGTS
ncbi:GNAT family N-acetyltransferase, partial [Candidatus Omnitrophota bacterium]